MALESAIGAEPLSEGLSTAFVRIKRTGFSGSRCGRNRPLRRVAEDAQRLETGEERSISLQEN